MLDLGFDFEAIMSNSSVPSVSWNVRPLNLSVHINTEVDTNVIVGIVDGSASGKVRLALKKINH